MARQESVPAATNGRPLTTDKTTSRDRSLRSGHQLDDNPMKPITPLSVSGGRAHMGDRGLFSSDDTALAKQIQATHSSDVDDLNVKPVLSIVEDILLLGRPSAADTSLDGKVETENEKKGVQSSHQYDHDTEILGLLAFPISKITCEIIGKCASGGEAHSATMELLQSLSSYSWDAKVVIAFAAFAINYGEFWLVEHLHTKNPLAKNIATLKDLPHVMENAGRLAKKFEAVIDLLNGALKVTHCLVEFRKLPSQYIRHDAPQVVAATAHIPTAVYWIIRSILACASTLINLIGSGHEYITSTAESWEILNLAHKLTVILDHLQRQLAVCKDLIESKKAEDAYIAFKRLIESSHIDNMKVLRAMFRARDDQNPLYNGSTKINERLEVLRTKYVLLLISDLDIPQEELNVLHMIYDQKERRHEHEVLWLPVVDPRTPMTELQNTVFYNLRNTSMPWHSVDHPPLIEPVMIRYIREELKFVHRPMLIVLDPRGKPSKTDALPMMWIWGSEGFPFTKDQELLIWRDKKWNMELLADSIHLSIPEWIRNNRLVCLYGGEDIEWIRKFTIATRAAATLLHLPLEMLYVGKRNPKDKVRRCHEIIHKEKLSHIFSVTEYYDYVWYFWVRLWSMWNSKKQVGMSVENDHIMQQIMHILTYDSSEQGWAVFSRGNYEITMGKGDVVLLVMERYTSWADRVENPDMLVTVLDEEIRRTHLDHHCNRLILPEHAGYLPERVMCSECGKEMEKNVMYRCCTD